MESLRLINIELNEIKEIMERLFWKLEDIEPKFKQMEYDQQGAETISFQPVTLETVERILERSTYRYRRAEWIVEDGDGSREKTRTIHSPLQSITHFESSLTLQIQK